jgi:phosphatidylglycerophosphate synthase
VIDSALLPLVSRALSPGARGLAAAGVSADAITLAGLVVGLSGAGLIAAGRFETGLAAILASRVCDGLDGAVARINGPTDRGAFLDAAFDFVFYASIPAGFALADPARNALAASLLLLAFMGTASSFLAFAVLAARRGLASAAFPRKGIFYLGGLTEAAETLLCFAAMCLWPAAFAPIALVFAAACAVTTVMRWWWGWRLFGKEP